MPQIRTDSFGNPDDMEYSVYMETDKAKSKFIKRCENMIRSSLEYRDYIAYLKDYLDMSHCAFFENVENGNGSRVKIEIHHEPLTLYDIVQTVLNKHQEEGIPINDLFIADEVMDLHYQNMVGLIPLSKSIHQIVHHGTDIVIPLSLVYGNYKKFIEEYQDYLDDYVLDKLERKVNETKTIKVEQMQNTLSPTYVYVNVDGFELPQKVAIEKESIA